MHVAVVRPHTSRKLGTKLPLPHVRYPNDVVHSGLQGDGINNNTWQGVERQGIHREGIHIQRIREVLMSQGMDPMGIAFPCAHVCQRIGNIGDPWLAFAIQ